MSPPPAESEPVYRRAVTEQLPDDLQRCGVLTLDVAPRKLMAVVNRYLQIKARALV